MIVTVNHRSRLTTCTRDLEVLARASLCDVLFVLSTEKIRTVIATVLPVIRTVAFPPHAIDSFEKCATRLHEEMRVGPSEPACRGRLQTTLSCIGKEPVL